MLKKVIFIFKSDLVKVTSKTGAATAVKIAASFIVSKIVAIFVGPAGLAVMGQLNNVGNIFQSFSTGGIPVGVTKYISEHSDDKLKQQEIINNALKIAFLCSCFSSVLVLVFYRYIGHNFFHTDKYNSIILVLGCTLILFSFNTLISAIINGLRNFKLFIIIDIGTSVVSLLSTGSLVYFFGVYGALLSFVLVPAIVFFISWFLVRKEVWVNYKLFNVKLNKDVVKLLGKFSLMAINNAIVGAFAQIAIRSLITKKMDLNVAGIWDATNKLSGAYLLLITTSIQVYYLPTLSYIQDKKLLWKEMMKTEKIIVPLTAMMFVFIYLLRGLIIDILFTKEFYLMKSILIYQLIGDIIKIASWVLSYTMIAKAMTKNLIITDNLFTLIYIVISYSFMNSLGYGLNSVYYAYMINNSIYLVFMYFFMKRIILKKM